MQWKEGMHVSNWHFISPDQVKGKRKEEHTDIFCPVS